jgi:diadenosine tetraphosphate (Ap4A) HIT family hydrolase
MTTTPCETCTRLIARNQGTAPLWDAIYRTTFWDVVHSYNTSLPGWLVLVARRHIEAIAELTPPEAVELGLLLQRVSQALQATTGCVKTYVIQFAEAAEHSHVHFHIVPRMADQPRERRGPHIFGYLGVAEHERVDEATMNELARRVRERLEVDRNVADN